MVTLFALHLASCAGGRYDRESLRGFDESLSREEIRSAIARLGDRKDPEACLTRADAYERLRELGGSSDPGLLSLGDAADIEVLSGPSPREFKSRSAARLFCHFMERSQARSVARTRFEGPWADQVEEYILLSVAARYGALASRESHSFVLSKLAKLSGRLAAIDGLGPELRAYWTDRGRAFELEARECATGGAAAPEEPGSEGMRFVTSDPDRHARDAIAAADLATQELASRGKTEHVLESYLNAMFHFAVLRNCSPDGGARLEASLAAELMVARRVDALLQKDR